MGDEIDIKRGRFTVPTPGDTEWRRPLQRLTQELQRFSDDVWEMFRRVKNSLPGETAEADQDWFLDDAEYVSGVVGPSTSGTQTLEVCHFDFPAKATPAAVAMTGHFFMLTQDEDGLADADAYIEEIKFAMHRKDDGTVVVGAVTEGDNAESSATGGFPWTFAVAHSTPVTGTSRLTLSVTGTSSDNAKLYQAWFKCAWAFRDADISMST